MKLRTAASLLERTAVGPLLRRFGSWRGVVVLNYHRIGDWHGSPFDRNLYSARQDELDAQARVLSRETDVLAAGDVLEAAGRRGRSVLVTFDDGYRDNHELALPVLRAHGVHATFFVATGFIDDPRVPWWDEVAWMVRSSPREGIAGVPDHPAPLTWDEPDRERAAAALTAVCKRLAPPERERYLDDLAEATGSGRCTDPAWRDAWMTWDMVRALRDGGMAVGGHTVSHPILSTLDADGQRGEIDGCARRLADELGEPMRLFSYPVGLDGTYDDDTRAALRDCGVDLAFTFAGGVAGGPELDPLTVPRTTVSGYMSGAEFRARVTLPRTFARW